MSMAAMRILSLLVALLVAASAGAATYLVQADGGGDFPHIAAALLSAISSDVIELGNGVFTGSGNRDLDFAGKAITLRSQSGDRSACVIDAGGSPGAPHRVLLFTSGETLLARVEGITLRGGDVTSAGSGVGGAVLIEGASPRFEDCVIEGSAAGRGGGVHCWSARPRFTDCEIRDNTAAAGGGGVSFDGESNLVFVNCLIAGNQAERGGGLFGLDSRLSLSDCVVAGNTASLRGGGMYAGSDSDSDLSSCTFAYNEAPTGGALDAVFNSHYHFTQSIVAFSAVGGALAMSYGSSAEFSCSNLYGNAGGDWAGDIAGQVGIWGNVSAEPQFCGVAGSGNYYLQSDSPCAAAQSGCGDMGAMGVGCGTTATERSSWSLLKGLFRD